MNEADYLRARGVNVDCPLYGVSMDPKPVDDGTQFVLRYVFVGKRSLVEQCGFIRYEDADGEPIYVEPWTLKGPLADVPRNLVRWWLMQRGVAGQIYECRVWGAGPD